MKYLIFVFLFCCQVIASQTTSDNSDTIDVSHSKMQQLKSINGLGLIEGNDKLKRKRDYILSKYKMANKGDVAHDFVAINAQGDSVRFSLLKDKYKLLVFTSSYCWPCIKSLKELRTVHETYNNSLDVISFYKDNEMQAMLETIEEKDISWICLWDEQGFYNTTLIKYGVRGVPMFFLIDNNGVIVDLWKGYREGTIKERIDKVLD